MLCHGESWIACKGLNQRVYDSPPNAIRPSGCIADILLNVFPYDPLAKIKKWNEQVNIPCFKSRLLHCGDRKEKIVYVQGGHPEGSKTRKWNEGIKLCMQMNETMSSGTGFRFLHLPTPP